ncbi:MAG: response regulator [Acidimicrobiia bacterium]
MEFENDPELERLFKDELDERAASLGEGAQAMLDGEITSEIAGRMLREGHTIKGTGRVMGYEGIARGGETCELIWRWIQQGDLESSSMLGRTLMHLSDAIPQALGGDEEPVSMAIDTVRTLIDDPAKLEELPRPLGDDENGQEGDVPDDIESSDNSDEETTDEGPEAIDNTGEVTEDSSESDADEGSEPDAGSVTEEDVESEATAETEETPATLDTIDVEVTVSTTETDDTESDVGDEPDSSDPTEEPLVFEPGPDGKLPTPVITYEIVHDAFDGVEAVSGEAGRASGGTLMEPPGLALVGEKRSILDPDTADAYDLGGLVGAVEAWAAEESVPVNAGRLFRMINDVAALRIDLASTIRHTEQVLNTADGVSLVAFEGSMEALETVRRASVRLESAALGLTMMPLTNITSTLPQLARYLSKRVGRDIELVIEGEDTVVDRQMVDRIGEIIRHLVVNALAHGIEDSETRITRGKSEHGTVKLALSRDDQHLQIVVADDGSGIDWPRVREIAQKRELVEDDPTEEQLRAVVFSEGFSTSPGQSEFTGEGDGLARVTTIVEEVFGTMTMESSPGRGTTFVVTLPAHRALQRAQIFTAGGHSWGIPESSILAILNIQDVAISVTEQGSTIGYGSETVPYSSFATVAGLDVEGLPSQVLVLKSSMGHIALAVDDVLDLHEVATKDLGALLSGASVVSGVALLGADETVMLVDAGRLADNLRDLAIRPSGPVHTVLIVDDSQGVRQVVSGVLASHGFSTVSAGSVSDALAALAKNEIDALVVDFSMPRADGVALVHMVRQRYGDIPVVMLSGVASEEDRSRAERAGVHAFFDKADFAKGALVDKLAELIAERVAQTEADIAS